MAAYQTAYSNSPAIGLPGQIANEELANKISRTVESSAGIEFGQPAFRGAGDRGCVIGSTFAATGAGSEGAANVGTSTITDVPTIAAGAKPGRYTITQLNTAGTGELVIEDPDGVAVGNGVVGTEFTVDGITATVTAGGTPTAGDTFYVDVTYTANAKFLGLAILNRAVPAASTTPDKYPQYFQAALMTQGNMYVTAGASVADGDAVYWNPATKRFTNTTTHIRIPDATFDTSGGNGDIVEVSLKLR